MIALCQIQLFFGPQCSPFPSFLWDVLETYSYDYTIQMLVRILDPFLCQFIAYCDIGLIQEFIYG